MKAPWSLHSSAVLDRAILSFVPDSKMALFLSLLLVGCWGWIFSFPFLPSKNREYTVFFAVYDTLSCLSTTRPRCRFSPILSSHHYQLTPWWQIFDDVGGYNKWRYTINKRGFALSVMSHVAGVNRPGRSWWRNNPWSLTRKGLMGPPPIPLLILLHSWPQVGDSKSTRIWFFVCKAHRSWSSGMKVRSSIEQKRVVLDWEVCNLVWSENYSSYRWKECSLWFLVGRDT